MPHPHLKVANSPAGYRWLRLDRPERRNALDVSLMVAVRDAIAADPEVPVLIGSTDPRIFCAGADLTIPDAERAAISDMIYDCCQTMITRPGPVIAVLTGRWVDAAEALTLGLVNRVEEDPERSAELIAADLATRGTGAGAKAVMAAGGLLDRLRAEREVNRSAWARLTGTASHDR